MAKQEKKMMRRRMANAYLSSIVSIALVLMLIGTASLLIVNAGSVSDYFKENLKVSVILKQEIGERQAAKLQEKLETLPYVNTARYVSREEGTQDLQKMLGEDFLSVFETSPVPTSIDLTLFAEYVCADSIEVVRKQLVNYPEVDEVDCQQSLVDALNTNLAKVSLVLGVFIILMLFISFVLIGNTIRLNVFSRRFTIHTMKMVGATRSFIRKPFLISAIYQGLLSAAIALVALGTGLLVLKSSFPELFEIVRTGMIATVGLIVIASGVTICVTSTYFVVGKLISLDKNDLYY
ncbi:MAG: permease-like cell division protein FtsX [Bacteroidales bacterium]|nr:permease-like cell division protein FtsX [Bacteroidales bacterium]